VGVNLVFLKGAEPDSPGTAVNEYRPVGTQMAAVYLSSLPPPESSPGQDGPECQTSTLCAHLGNGEHDL